MAELTTGMPERSYGCTYGCGNPYDVVLVMVLDGTTEFLCMPCFVQCAMAAIQAMTESDNPNVRTAMDAFSVNQSDMVPGPKANPGRRNAPATSDTPEAFGAFDESLALDGI